MADPPLKSVAEHLGMHPGFCPRCGERVTPFAAGCALCGADLDPRRWQAPPSLRQRMSLRLSMLRRLARPRAATRAAARRDRVRR